MNRVLIYRKARLLATNAGGPDGYLAHLKLGLDKVSSPTVVASFIGDAAPGLKPPAPPPGRKPRAAVAFGNFRRNLTSRLHLATGFPGKLDPFHYRVGASDAETLSALAGHKYAHAHYTRDADVLHRLRLAGRWSGKIILSSHCPEAPALEMEALMRPKHYCEAYYARLREKLLERDLDAFRQADAWIFPSEGAMEPYHQTLPGFTDLSRTKPTWFLPTGIRKPAGPERSAVQARRIAPADGLQITYIGRHESVKGYDLFVDAALRFLDRNPNAHVVCAGTGPIAPPSHPRWHELGRINDVPALMAASDLFVLPNRRTYFDLVLIEALAAGVAVLASATGGNRDVAQACPAVRLFEPSADGLFEALDELARRPDSERAALRAAARNHYESAHTETRFASGYLNTLGEIAGRLG